MSVNENIFTNKNDWITKRFSIKVPAYDNFINGVNQGYIELNTEIDKSITYVKVDSNCNFANVNLVRTNSNDDLEKYTVRDIYDVKNGKNKDVFLWCNNVTNFPISALTSLTDFYSTSSYQKYIFGVDAVAEDNVYENVSPILSLGDNLNYRLLIMVNAYGSFAYQKKPDITTTFDDYFNNYRLQYPYISNIYGILLINNNGWKVVNYSSSTTNNQNMLISTGILNLNSDIKKYYDNNNLREIITYRPCSSTSFYNGSCLEIGTNQKVQSRSIFSVFGGVVNDVGVYGTKRYCSIIGNLPNLENFTDSVEENGVLFQRSVRTTNVNNYDYRIYINTNSNYWNSIDDLKEWIKKQCAYFGMYFVLSYDDAPKNFNENGVFLGIIDENGVTHGEYSEGRENLKQINASGDLINDINKSDSESKDENDKGDLTSNTNQFLFTSANQLFILNDTSLVDLMKFINVGYQPDETQFFRDFKGKNPIDYIVSLVQYPFVISSPVDVNLFIGGIPVTKAPFLENAERVQVKRLTNQQAIFNFGSLTISPYFNDFRDYEPFTKCELQLPFCGVYNVDLRRFMNKIISVKYVVDFATGACTAYIFLNDLIIDTINGQIGFSIPLSGIAQGDYQNTMQRNSFNQKSAMYDLAKTSTNIIGNGFNGNLQGAVNSAVNGLQDVENYLQSNYELTHFNLPPTEITTTDSLNSFYQDNRARLVFYRCREIPHNKEIFSKVVGYACLKNGKLGDFSEFVVCSNAKLNNINATETEKNMIYNLLLNGVYN